MNNLVFFISKINNFIKHHAFALVLFLVIIMGSLIAFREFYYFGTLHIYSSEENYTVVIDGKGEYQCAESFCSIKISPNSYKAEIRKEDFYPLSQSFEITIGEITEISLKLDRKKEKLEWIHSTTLQNKGVEFPLVQSSKDDSIENLSIRDNSVFYNTTQLYSSTSPIFVSTDEIGRNAWIVSESEVIGFTQATKQLIPAIEGSIKRFFPQSNGGFSWENEENELFYFDGETNKTLAIKPLSLFSACHIPSRHNRLEENPPHEEIEEKWAYLAITEERKIGLYAHNPFTLSQTSQTPHVIMENILALDILYIECLASNKIKGFLKNGKIFIISF